MLTEVKMPQLSDTMNAGKILKWKKNPGDKISRGDILAEVETEKANLEIESFYEGTLLHILVPELTSARVGEIIAYIGNPNESAPAPKQEGAKVPVATDQTNGHSPVIPKVAAPTVTPSPTSVLTQPQSQSRTDLSTTSERVKASPLARKVAEGKNIDLSTLHGSGPEGRIVLKDVERAEQGSGSVSVRNEQVSAPSQSTATQIQEPPRTSPTQSGEGKLIPFSKMRETIARRMQESVTESPHFYTTISVDMAEASKLREALKAEPQFKGISVNHLIVKAAAYALSKEPRVNRAVRDGQVYEPGAINIGIITAVEDGLLIPVIRNADKVPLNDIVFEARAAVERAKAGRPNSSDLVGGTFSISNMGMFDVESFTAIINPGQGAVLAVSSVKEEPVVKDGQIVVGTRMRVTLSVDHRVIDGAMSASFLGHFRRALEVPGLLLVP